VHDFDNVGLKILACIVCNLLFRSLS